MLLHCGQLSVALIGVVMVFVAKSEVCPTMPHEIQLDVTTDQEEAIKALFAEHGWSYRNLNACKGPPITAGAGTGGACSANSTPSSASVTPDATGVDEATKRLRQLQLENREGTFVEPRAPNLEALPWHGSKEFLKLVKEFHDQKARIPKAELQAAKPHHKETMERIRDDLKDYNMCKELQYTGSSYEGIKVPSSDLEFDVMVILHGGDYLVKDPDPVSPGYVKLRPIPEKEGFFDGKLKDGVLSAELTVRKFFGELDKSVNRLKLGETSKKVQRRHGPAAQLDFMKEDGSVWYSVDVVPAFKIKGEYFVAKSYKKEKEAAKGKPPMSWRRSYSMEEKKLMNTIDGQGDGDATGNGCRRQCVRIMKVLKDKIEHLRPLQSYFIKTTMLQLNREFNEPQHWNRDKLGVRLINMMERLANYLQIGRIPHYYIPEMNLLEDMGGKKLENMANMIFRALNSKDTMRKWLAVEE